MALTLLAANNAQTVLAAGISASATSMTVNTGTGNLFPSPVSGASFFKLTLIDAATGQISEIVHVTGRSGDNMTISRAQEGTTARAWSANDIAANMMTAGTISYIMSNTQPLDAMLTSLASLNTVNLQFPVFNGPKSIGLGSLTNLSLDFLSKSTSAEMLSLLLAAPVNSPTFTGDPKAPTPAAGDNDTSIATTAFVKTAIGNLQGKQKFPGVGSFTVPTGVSLIYLSGCAGGGGGGAGGGGGNNGAFGAGGGGGGAGQSIFREPYAVTPGQVINITIGAGGAAGVPASATTGGNGGAGGNTVIGSLVTLNGGVGGSGGLSSGSVAPGGNPGSGYPYGGFGGDGSLNVATAYGGSGGSCPFGGGGNSGRAATTDGVGATAASGYGAGGAGGGGHYGNVSPLYAGGAGSAGMPGVVFIEW